VTEAALPRPNVIIIGGGFGGLYAAKRLSGEAVSVELVDRKNHHTFQPLLYQVALAVLSPVKSRRRCVTFYVRHRTSRQCSPR
jgi:NADH dehydrogenase FAD-containing subunit